MPQSRIAHRQWMTAFCVLSVFIMPATLHGESWSRTAGPPGGEITSFASSGSFVFAGTRGGGLYRSNDAESWSSLRNELCSTCTIIDLAVIDGHVFAATEQDGIFRAANDGDTWEPMNAGLPGLRVLQFVVQAPDLWALVDTEFGGGELYHSTNLGASWQLSESPSQFVRIVALPSVIFGSPTFAQTSLMRSTDGGQTWDFPAGSGFTGSGGVTVFAVSGSTLFAASDSSNTIFKTTDAGENWTQVNTPIPSGVVVRKMEAIGTALFVAAWIDGPALYRSIDQGETWTPADTGLASGQGRRIDRIGAHAGQILVATTKGVFRSENLGDSWQEANSGLVATHVQSLASDGVTWFATIAHASFVQSPFTESPSLDVVFRSIDHGASWTAGHAGFPEGSSVNNVISKGGLVFAGTTRDGVFRSDDGGQTWSPAREGLPQPYGAYGEIGAFAIDGSRLFAGTFRRTLPGVHGTNKTQGGGIFRSANDGATWEPINNGIPLSGVNNPPFDYTHYDDCNALFQAEDALFAALSNLGIYRSTDQGNSWTAVNAGVPQINGAYPNIRAFAQLGTDLFAAWGFDSGGVLRSGDGGLTWTVVSAFTNGRPINSLATDCVRLFAAVGSDVYEADPADGVFVSADYGASWTRVGEDLDGIPAAPLVIHGADMMAGTLGAGMWRATVAEDCNSNGTADGCDIATGSSVDANLNGAPDECEIPGDLNCDGAFDTQDIEPFVLALIDPVEYDAAFEDCNILNADLLPDSLINGSDVQSFAAQLIAP